MHKTAYTYTFSVRQKKKPDEWNIAAGERLRHVMEDIRKMSPEELAVKTGNQVSASYIRRVIKGQHNPTILKLNMILKALDTNMGAFFEYEIDASRDIAAEDRRWGRVLQRALESDARASVISMMKIIDKKQ